MKQDDSGPLKGSLSPVKPKIFTGKDELVLTTEILHDVKKGVEIPTKKTDGYWSTLADRLHDRMEDSRSKEQLCEKTKRMKVRYLSMTEKFKEIGEQKFRNTADKELFSLWDQIWGSSGATEVDHTSKVKNKQSKVSATERPAKEVKTSNDKSAPVQDAKVVIEESEEHDNSGDESESEDSDGHHDSQKKSLIAAPMEVDKQDDHDKHAFVQKNDSDNLVFQPACKEHDVLHREILAALTEIQESSRQTMKEWKSKALFVIENAVKTLVDQSRTLSGFEIGGLDGCFSPSRSISLGVKEVDEVDQALQHQWHELRLKELELYGQRLELMRMECKLKQDQMRLKLQQDK
ncbi:hypothetical protein KP509_13G081400 [Ceratopteris richardii]|nr:hypothetical protein KP509_13G081400 [Ceratopteris richardii]